MKNIPNFIYFGFHHIKPMYPVRCFRAASQVEGIVPCDENKASLVLRTAASQGSVRMWDAVVHDLMTPADKVEPS